jgi:hypothetical protein
MGQVAAVRGDDGDQAARFAVLLERPGAQPLTIRLAGAGSLRRELEALLVAAPPNATADDYRTLLLDQNAAGKDSATARMWAWKRLKLRYALDPGIAEHQPFLAAMRSTADPSQRGLIAFLMFARTDRLFREVTLDCVSPYLSKEGTIIEPEDIEAAIRRRAEVAGLRWSASAQRTASHHLLSALKDFGLIRGSRTRRTVRPRPGAEVTRFATWLGRLERLTDRQILDSQWFRLLGLDRDQAADLLYAASRAGILSFRMQADVVELRLPAPEAQQ